MINDWFTADDHFGHRRIIEYSKRPFTTIEEHDEALIANWNARVQPGDNVYHLGDLTFLKPEKAKPLIERLNGKIHYIQGNHDKTAFALRGMFVWYKEVAEIEVQGQAIWLSHYAHRVWNRSHHGVWHLYGHSHGSLPDLKDSMSFDVGVDCHGYKPISFDEVKAIMSKKSFVPVDHHGDREFEQKEEAFAYAI